MKLNQKTQIENLRLIQIDACMDIKSKIKPNRIFISKCRNVIQTIT